MRYSPDTITVGDAQTTEAGTRWWEVYSGSTQIGTVTRTAEGNYRARSNGELGIFPRLTAAVNAVAGAR